MLSLLAQAPEAMQYEYAMQAAPAAGPVISPFVWFMYFAFIALLIVGMWKVFTKAGKPGWASLIPFYNSYVMIKIAGKPGWWFLLLFVPFVNWIVILLLSVGIAKKFGRSAAFGIIMLFFFSIIGYLMLGFGSAEYEKVAVAPEATPAA